MKYVSLFFFKPFIANPYFPRQLILTEDSNIHRNPYICASGTSDEIDPASLTFNFTPSQFINLPHKVLDCLLTCFIDPDSKKWKNKKPLPTTGAMISVTGILTKIKRDSTHKIIFQVELDSIAYLPHQSGGTTSSSNRLDGPLATTSHTTGRFDYDNIIIPSSTNPPTPPPVTLGKRKVQDTLEDSSQTDEKRSHTASDTSE